MKLASALLIAALNVIATTSAHAEKYCKAIDQNGNASYTIAPETGCKKKFKTVGVKQYRGTVSPAVTAIMEQNNATHGAGNAPSKVDPVTPSTESSAPAPTKSSAPAPTKSKTAS
ncbi:MAG: hypothetical protein NVSMB40_02090 [Aquirhabdus sp.]